jgi:hypothetical protein
MAKGGGKVRFKTLAMDGRRRDSKRAQAALAAMLAGLDEGQLTDLERLDVENAAAAFGQLRNLQERGDAVEPAVVLAAENVYRRSLAPVRGLLRRTAIRRSARAQHG